MGCMATMLVVLKKESHRLLSYVTTNMAAVSLSFESQGSGYKPLIV